MNPQEILGILLLYKNRELLTIKLCLINPPELFESFPYEIPSCITVEQQEENDLSA